VYTHGAASAYAQPEATHSRSAIASGTSAEGPSHAR
jgi:hypothetical protein